MKKETKKKIYGSMLGLCAAAVVLEILFAHPHGEEFWHKVPGADLVIAFVGGWALILLAKKVLAPLLQRNEDYYEEGKKDE